MKKHYVIALGILLVLLVLGCQSQPVEVVTEESPEAAEEAMEVEEQIIEEEEEEEEEEIVEEEPTVEPSPIQSATVVENVKEAEEPSSPVMVMEEIGILGAQGFDPAEISISEGDILIWKNGDPREKTAVLTFQKDKGRKLFNSVSIQPGETYTHNFEEAGTYDYWTQGYGVRGKVVVE